MTIQTLWRLKNPLFVVFLILATLACVWQHVRLIGSGYETERLRAERRTLLQEQRALQLEAASLASLDRVETIAVGRLHLGPPDEGQVVIVQPGAPGRKEAPKSRELRLAHQDADGG